MFQSHISHLFSQESSNFKFLGELSEREGAKFKLLEKLGIYYFLSFLFPQISGSAPKLDPAHLLVKLAGKNTKNIDIRNIDLSKKDVRGLH